MTREMSEAYKNQEDENKQKKADQAVVEETAKTKVYWSQPERLRIANFVKEIKDASGGIITPERPLRFEEHTYTTSDPKIMKFIEESGDFASNTIRACPGGIDEARKFTRELRTFKQVKDIKYEDISNVHIKDK